MQVNQEILVALGSNLPSDAGGPAETLSAAIQCFQRESLQPLRVSRYFATEAFPKGSGPDYVNATAVLRAAMAPADVMAALHRIEARFDRKREARWGARTLDLDLIAMGDAVLPDAQGQARWRTLPADQQMQRTPDHLILPHPRLQDRAFVLIPLRDVAPHWRHPLLGRTVLEMCAALPAEEAAAPRPVR